jgi:hypothetical protein
MSKRTKKARTERKPLIETLPPLMDEVTAAMTYLRHLPYTYVHVWVDYFQTEIDSAYSHLRRAAANLDEAYAAAQSIYQNGNGPTL